MSKIKIKDDIKRDIKTLDKIAGDIKEKDNTIKSNESPVEDASNKILMSSKVLAKEGIDYTRHKGSKEFKKTIQRINSIKQNKSLKKDYKRYIKNTKRTIKKTKETQEKVNKSKNVVKKSIDTIVRSVKATIMFSIKIIRGLIVAIVSLLSAIIAGGWIVLVGVLTIGIIGILCSSIFGIFFSSEKENPVKMNEVIRELNLELDNKIQIIKNTNPHNESVIHSNKADWKDVLSIYSIKVNKGTNENEVMTINEEKKNILHEIFFDMNYLTYEIKKEEYQSSSIGALDYSQIDLNNVNLQNLNEKIVLHIYINSRTKEEMINKYNFSDEQKNLFYEINDDKYTAMWSNVIYGSFSSTGEIKDWKQFGKEWSNIEIGNSGYTIGKIGCLTTSISILIKKSGVPTYNIQPFNPGTFVIALNNVYGFDSLGGINVYAVTKIIPEFEYIDTINLRGKSKEDKLYEIKKYYDSGYYLALEVKGATKDAQHWVAIDNVTNSSILMLDPASDEINVWEKYDWTKTSQFIYFNAKK